MGADAVQEWLGALDQTILNAPLNIRRSPSRGCPPPLDSLRRDQTLGLVRGA